jgi:hypothetical protein
MLAAQARHAIGNAQKSGQARRRYRIEARRGAARRPDRSAELDESQESANAGARLPGFVLSERELRDIGDARLPRGAVVTRAGVAAWPLLRFVVCGGARDLDEDDSVRA